MKKVINGKMYDTQKAEQIAYASHSHQSVFERFETSLYKTPNGSYFTNGWVGSKGITALSEDEALAWCEQHNIAADVIAEYFDIDDA